MTGAKLSALLKEKPWGRLDLPSPYGRQSDAVGEVWFDAPPMLADVLVKYLFTSEKLSVQVHPTEPNSPIGCGKDECWLVTEARADAILALGFRQEFAIDRIKTAVADGSISHMLDWRAARVGDFYYVPAGTVHAIGPGMTLIEVQQNADITYRLYDYSRPRTLHIAQALESLDPGSYDDALHKRVSPELSQRLVDGPHFIVDHLAGNVGASAKARIRGIAQVLPIEGTCQIGDQTMGAGESGWADTVELIDFSKCKRALVISQPCELPSG